jgi:hypothetical protein
MDGEGMSTLIDVLQLSHNDAQFLLLVRVSAFYGALLGTKTLSEIQQRCIQGHSRIFREPGCPKAGSGQPPSTSPKTMDLSQQQPTRGWDEPPPYHNTDIPSQAPFPPSADYIKLT